MSDTGQNGVRTILAAERLGHFNWFEDRALRADEVGIVRPRAGWPVYVTDERANPRYDEVHGDEGEALADFLARVRAINHILERRKERHQPTTDPSAAVRANPGRRNQASPG